MCWPEIAGTFGSPVVAENWAGGGVIEDDGSGVDVDFGGGLMGSTFTTK